MTHIDADDADPFRDPFMFEPRARLRNSIAVHTVNHLQHVATASAGPDTPIAGSLLSPNGLKVLLASPQEGKLLLWDVWGKSKARPQGSFHRGHTIR